MPALNWYLTNVISAAGNRTVDEAFQAATNTVDGWTVSTTGDSTTSAFAAGVKRAATTFVGTTQPDGSIDIALDDAWRTTNTYSGSFAAANWTFTAVVRAGASATGQAGAVVVRLLRGTAADGSNAVEVTSAQQTGTTTAAMSATATDYTSTVTFNPGAFSVNNEYLFFQIAWKRITAASMTTADVNWRTGSSASLGTRIVSSVFTVPQTAFIAEVVSVADAVVVDAVSVVANTANAWDFGRDTTPTLSFTGTDSVSHALRYNIQIATDSGFSSVIQDKVSNVDAGFPQTTVNQPVDGIDYSLIDTSSSVGLAWSYYQTFKPSIACALKSISLKLSPLGSAGNFVVYVYAQTGTYGSDQSKPTGPALAASDAKTFAQISQSAPTTFTFSGGNQIALTAGTAYCAVLNFTGINSNMVVAVTSLGASLGLPGNMGDGNISTMVWTANTVYDIPFEIIAAPASDDPYPSGQPQTFTVQSPLAAGTYYWRVRAVDPAGTNTYSSWTTGRSFIVGIVGACAETVSVADSVSGGLVIGIALSDAVSVTDAVVASTAKPASVAETMSVADAMTTGVVTSASVAETITVADSATVPPGVFVPVYTALVNGHPLNYFPLNGLLNFTYAVSVAETTLVTDQIAAATAFPASRSEFAAIADSVGATAAAAASLAETAAVSDVLAANSILGAARVESAAVADSVSFTLLAAAVLVETASVADALSATGVYVAALAEAVAVTDNIAPGGLATGSESVAVTDQLSVRWVANVSVAESTAASDQVSARWATTAAVAESTAVTDQQSTAWVTTGSVSESVFATDVLNAVINKYASVAETVAVSETIIPFQTFTAFIIERTAVVDVLQRSLAMLPIPAVGFSPIVAEVDGNEIFGITVHDGFIYATVIRVGPIPVIVSSGELKMAA